MNRRPIFAARCTSALLAALGLCLAATATAAPSASAGTLLVAGEDLDDPNFYRAVVLLLHHDADGTVGLIVNQQAALSPSRLLPDVSGLERYTGGVFFGGPVDLSRVTVLSRSDRAGQAVVDGVYLSNDAPSLERLVADGHRDESSLRIFIGYAGWAAGQLESELARGSWQVTAATEALVFRRDPATLWDALYRQPSPGKLLRVDAAGAASACSPAAPGAGTASVDGGIRVNWLDSSPWRPCTAAPFTPPAPEWLNW